MRPEPHSPLIPCSALPQSSARSGFSWAARRLLWRARLRQRTIYRPNPDTDAKPLLHSRNLEPACLPACRSGASVRDTGGGLSPEESPRGTARFSRQDREKLEGERSVQETDRLPARSAGVCDRPRRASVTGRLGFTGQHAMAEQSRREGKGSLGARGLASWSYLSVAIIQPKVIRAKASSAASIVSHLSRTPQQFTLSLSVQPPAALAARTTPHSRHRAQSRSILLSG